MCCKEQIWYQLQRDWGLHLSRWVKSVDTMKKTGPLSQYGSFISGISSYYFQNISLPRKTIAHVYGIRENYGNLIFQPFSTIFPNDCHTMEEVQCFQWHWSWSLWCYSSFTYLSLSYYAFNWTRYYIVLFVHWNTTGPKLFVERREL